jgi:hypothetical protein
MGTIRETRKSVLSFAAQSVNETSERTGRLRSRQDAIALRFFSALSARLARKNILCQIAKKSKNNQRIKSF